MHSIVFDIHTIYGPGIVLRFYPVVSQMPIRQQQQQQMPICKHSQRMRLSSRTIDRFNSFSSTLFLSLSLYLHLPHYAIRMMALLHSYNNNNNNQMKRKTKIVRNENSMTPLNNGDIEKSQQMLMASRALSGHLPIRPTPLGIAAAAAAAAAFRGSMNLSWPGSQLASYPGVYGAGPGFGAGHHGQGMLRFNFLLFLLFFFFDQYFATFATNGQSNQRVEWA